MKPETKQAIKDTIDKLRELNAELEELNNRRAQTIKHARKQKLDVKLLCRVAQILDSVDPLAFEDDIKRIKETLDLYASFGLKPNVASESLRAHAHARVLP